MQLLALFAAADQDGAGGEDSSGGLNGDGVLEEEGAPAALEQVEHLAAHEHQSLADRKVSRCRL